MPKATSTKTHPRRLASISDTAEYLGLTSRTIRVCIADGRLRAYKLGSKIVRLDLDEVDAALRPIPSAASGGGDRASA
jgi:excisionase family DNA binding protein